jgi:putative transposase
MKNLYHSLLLLIAGSTQKELAAQIRYLKIENDVLRSKLPDRVSVTDRERNRLVKFAAKLGRALNELVTIVHPNTMRRWISEAGQAKKRKPAKKGRPKTEEQIRELRHAPISRTVGGYPLAPMVARMRSSTCRWRLVKSFMI